MPVESATCLETLVRKALPAFTASGREKPSKRSHYKVKQTSLFWNSCSRGHFQFLFLTDTICGLGILATCGLITARPQSRAQFQLQSYSNASDGNLQSSNWEISHFPHPNPRGGRSRSTTSPGSDQMAVLGLQQNIHCKVVPSSKKLHADSHGDYKHGSNQTLYKKCFFLLCFFLN